MKFTTLFGLRSQTTRLRERDAYGRRPHHPDRPSTFSGAPVKGDLERCRRRRRDALYATAPGPRGGRLGFSAGLFPVQSPLLRESLLVSFPLLTDMLKFSR